MVNKIKNFLKLFKQKLFPNNYKLGKGKINKGRCFICDSIKEGSLINLHDGYVINLCPKCSKKLAIRLKGIWYNDIGLLNTFMEIRYDYKDYISRKKLKRRIR